MTALAPETFGDVKDVRDLVNELLVDSMSKLAAEAGKSDSPFFRSGIELITLKLHVGSIEVGFTVAGKDAPKINPLAPEAEGAPEASAVPTGPNGSRL